LGNLLNHAASRTAVPSVPIVRHNKKAGVTATEYGKWLKGFTKK
jgi:hypothetical protein